MQEYIEGTPLKDGETIWTDKKTGKKYVRKEVTLKQAKKSEKKLRKEKDDLFLYVALKYPQYTLKELYEDIPIKQVVMLAKFAQEKEARDHLILNSIINGPNSKDKQHKSYKDTIELLIKQAGIKDESMSSVKKLI